ncbi:MAG: oxidoreductase [Bacteroidota bacterium]|nr:MAG: oxidoreductase [Bacteroidota bacterium]
MNQQEYTPDQLLSPKNASTEDTVFRIHSVKNLTESTYILRFDRHGMEFSPGQHITLGMPDDKQLREYSVYSANNVDYLEVLIKEVEEGHVSKKLKKLSAGQPIKVEGPFGFFTLDAKKTATHKYLFIASGTGIAPFHSIVNSHKNLKYTLLHGVKFGNEQYAAHEYPEGSYIGCTSRDRSGTFHGRVTDYLRAHAIDSDTLVYLCGNYEMIHEVYDILTTKGISPDNIRTEVYF